MYFNYNELLSTLISTGVSYHFKHVKSEITHACPLEVSEFSAYIGVFCVDTC